MRAFFENITPEMCRLSPVQFNEVRDTVIAYVAKLKGVNVRNTTKEQAVHHQNSNDENGHTPAPGSFNAVGGAFDNTYYTWVKETFRITTKKTSTGTETEFFPGSYDALTGEYVK